MLGIAEKLKELIGDQSVKSWAEGHDLPHTTVHDWIKFDRTPTGASMKALVAATGKPKEWWLDGKASPPVSVRVAAVPSLQSVPRLVAPATTPSIKPASDDLAAMSERVRIGKEIHELTKVAINPDWLFTGQGPMRLEESAPAPAATPAKAFPAVNIEALAVILQGALTVTPNAQPRELAEFCANLYQKHIDNGSITAEGMGTGNMNNAA